jgi:PDDEXK-like domain of unknown function (DUF3799)
VISEWVQPFEFARCPSVVAGMPDEVYHGDPVLGGSLSSSGARQLVPPGCPAKFDALRGGLGYHSTELDVGSAAHKKVLKVGQEIHVIEKEPGVPADSMRTNAAKFDAALARAAGKIPLLLDDYSTVCRMAEAVGRHPLASQLLQGAGGVSELSLFWTDERTGVRCRGRVDRWQRLPTGRVVAVDYKTTTSVTPREIAKAIKTYGYWQQGEFYSRGIRATELEPEPWFMFVFQEKTPPYMIQVVDLSPMALAYGRQLNDRALEVYRDCSESGIWPGYENAGEILTIDLPPYLQQEMEWS